MGIGKVMVKKQRTSDLIQQKIWTGDLSCVEQVAWLVSIYFVETGEVTLFSKHKFFMNSRCERKRLNTESDSLRTGVTQRNLQTREVINIKCWRGDENGFEHE